MSISAKNKSKDGRYIVKENDKEIKRLIVKRSAVRLVDKMSEHKYPEKRVFTVIHAKTGELIHINSAESFN